MANKRLSKVGGSRESQGVGQVLFGKGGLGYIARRGIDWGTSVAVQSLEGVARMAIQQPLELISLLPDLIPEVSLAAWNGLRLGCSADSVRIKAMTIEADGGGEEDPVGTAAIRKLFDNLPDEVGTFADCLSRNFLMTMFSGMCAVEAVPGPRGTGIAQVWPVNSLTLRFRRLDDGTLALFQRQTANPNGMGLYTSGMSGVYEAMPMDRFFWAGLDGFPDDPYGRAPFAPALTSVMECIAFIQGLLKAWKRAGLPRYDVGFDFEMWGRLARDIIGLTDPKQIDDWVQTKFNEGVGFFDDLNEDDAFFHDLNSKVGIMGGTANLSGSDRIWAILRLRLIQALKQMPTLMGVVEGSTETWSNVDWQIYAAGLETLVQKAASPLVRAAQLHLQLLGLPLRAEAEFNPIRANQRLTDAQAEGIEIANEEAKVRNNWQLNDTAAMTITGTAPPDEAQRNADTPTKFQPLGPALEGPDVGEAINETTSAALPLPPFRALNEQIARRKMYAEAVHGSGEPEIGNDL